MNTPTLDLDKTPDTEVADRILLALNNKGMKLTDLSEATRISYTGLRRGLHQHRTDKRSFTIFECGKIANALNLPPSALMPDAFAERSAA